MDLLDINSNGTGIDLDVAGFSGNANGSANWEGGTQDWMLESLGDDGIAASGNMTVGTVSFFNVPFSQYSVEVVSATALANTNVEILLNGNATNNNADGGSVSSFSWGSSSFGEGRDNWLIWDGVSPVEGTFYITFTEAGPSDYLIVNTIQITAIPEPRFAAILIGLSGFILVLMRNRQKG
jgi:hypothetical protein